MTTEEATLYRNWDDIIFELWHLASINQVQPLAAWVFKWPRGPARFLAGLKSQLDIYCWPKEPAKVWRLSNLSSVFPIPRIAVRCCSWRCRCHERQNVYLSIFMPILFRTSAISGKFCLLLAKHMDTTSWFFGMDTRIYY